MTAADFYFLEYRSAFTAMCELHTSNHPVSVETVAAQLNRADDKDRNLLDAIGGVQTLSATLVGANPAELEFWRDETIANRKRRELADTLLAYQQQIKDAPDPDKLRTGLEEKLSRLAGPEESDVAHVSDTSDALLKRVQRYITDPDAITGMETGWTEFDRLLDGARPGGVTVIYAKSGRFKSLFMQNMGHLFASRGHPGLWFTTEMPRLDVQERVLGLETGLNFRYLRKTGTLDQYVGDIARGIETVDSLPLFLSDGFEATTRSFRADVKRYKRWHNIEYVVADLVDHIQSSNSKTAGDTIAQQSEVSRAIKDVAKKEAVHVFAIAHVSKGDKIDARQVELPYEDIKGSSSKFQDSDICISIVPAAYGIPPELRMRDRLPEPHWYGLKREEIKQSVSDMGGVDVVVTVTKNRDGDTGQFLFWMSSLEGGRFQLVRCLN